MFKEWQEQEGQVSFMSGGGEGNVQGVAGTGRTGEFYVGGGEGNVQGVAGTGRTGEFYVGGRRGKCSRSGRNKKDR